MFCTFFFYSQTLKQFESKEVKTWNSIQLCFGLSYELNPNDNILKVRVLMNIIIVIVNHSFDTCS